MASSLRRSHRFRVSTFFEGILSSERSGCGSRRVPGARGEGGVFRLTPFLNYPWGDPKKCLKCHERLGPPGEHGRTSWEGEANGTGQEPPPRLRPALGRIRQRALALGGLGRAQSSRNSFGRAVLVSLLLSRAYYLTLARFLWFLVVPWLIYVAIWLAVIMVSYGIGFFRSLLLALALTFLSWLSSMLLGIRTLPG